MHKNYQALVGVGILTSLLVGVFIYGLFIGELELNKRQLLAIVFDYKAHKEHFVLLKLRLPRQVLALLVGAALAVAGAVLQTVTANDLADPGIIGINQGAAILALIALLFFDAPTIITLASCAFIGGFLAALLVYVLAWNKGLDPYRLVLIGIGVATFATALSSLLIAVGDSNDVAQAFFWLAGSLYAAKWSQVVAMIFVIAATLPLLLYLLLPLNALLLADENALSIGQNVNRLRQMSLLLAVLLAAMAVSLVGSLGFIGLLAPHLARQISSLNHVQLMPIAALIGALLLLTADVIGRSIIAPSELPAGIVVAIIGAPYFAFVLYLNRHEL